MLCTGPWNMTKRLEARLGSRLIVDAIIELDPTKADSALAKKRGSASEAAYTNTKVFPSVELYAREVSSGSLPLPKFVRAYTSSWLR